VKGSLLYHLVLIAEYGEGTLNFVVQTDFTPPELHMKIPLKKLRQESRQGSKWPLKMILRPRSRSPTPLMVSVGDRSMLYKKMECFYGSIPGVAASTMVDYVFEASDFGK